MKDLLVVHLFKSIPIILSASNSLENKKKVMRGRKRRVSSLYTFEKVFPLFSAFQTYLEIRGRGWEEEEMKGFLFLKGDSPNVSNLPSSYPYYIITRPRFTVELPFLLVEPYELDATAPTSTSSGAPRDLASTNAICARREAAAREGREGCRPRRPARRRGTLLRGGVGWATAKESDRHKEGHQQPALGWGVPIVSLIHEIYLSSLLLLSEFLVVKSCWKWVKIHTTSGIIKANVSLESYRCMI